ncbi:MAG: 4Fe-4S binding protein [Eubacteriales bacterium]
MNTYKVTAIYFSPTGTSEKGVKAIAKVLDTEFKSIDMTMVEAGIQEQEFDENDLVVFGAPVYGGRLFTKSGSALKQMKGNKTPCVITVTYGNRNYDDALLEMSDIAKEQGFIPIAGAALIGEHTFGEIELGRPNEADMKEDTAFADKIQEKLHTFSMGKIVGAIAMPGQYPYKDGGAGGGFRPSTLDTCVECGMCAKRCPMQAIDSEDVSKVDHEKCISCFRCIKSCPVQAKVCDNPEYITFAEGFTKRLSERRENEYFI